MSSESRRRYTKEFKIKAVQMITKQGYKISEAASQLGIDRSNLARWKRQMDPNGDHAFLGKGCPGQEKEELHRLRKEVKRLQLERDMLKKASAFFANLSK